MSRRIFTFVDPDRFIAGTIGEPGRRTFFLQARKGRELVSVALEKAQVAVLAQQLDALLDLLADRGVSGIPTDPDPERRGRHGAGPRARGDVVTAPMPGSVVAVHVAVGAHVAAGDGVVTLSAMKMEHVVNAPMAGRIGEIGVTVGEQVARGALLATLAPDDP